MGEVLCIDRDALGVSPKVQKQIMLEQILLKDTAYLDRDKLTDREKNRWLPLNLTTTVRSIYSNRVVCRKEGIYYHAYNNFVDIERTEHKGYDLVMFWASMSVMLLIDCNNFAMRNILSSASSFQCCGLYWNDNIVGPIVYSQVYVRDAEFPTLSEYYSKDITDVSVEDLKALYRRGNMSALLDEIVEVKEEK